MARIHLPFQVLLAVAALLAILALVPVQAHAGDDMTVAFADPEWTGDEIPPGQQCNRCGGNGQTPRFVVSHIPDEAVYLDIYFWDGHPQSGMNHKGDHGAIRVAVTDHAQMTTPAVSGDPGSMPEGVEALKMQKCGQCGPKNAYLPPCACLASFPGKHKYYALIRAVDAEGDDLAEEKVMIGTFR